ncbi:TasA family protein [Aeribacillus composti]|uniref:TasA family protein n=1 Tax=Aeribacillus composti TaxID=1868734 RepID=UPI00406A39CC
MGIKQKLGMGVATAALGLSLIWGGTYAYFNDVETSNNTFAAGTLDLTLDPQTIINVNNLKPGDWMEREFTLKNSGSLGISKVLLETDYTVTDAKNDNNGDDFGNHIKVQILKNVSNKEVIVYEKTLAQLKNLKPDLVQDEWLWWNIGGLDPNETDKFKVKFVFVDNNQDQNRFQGDSLKLTWKFDAKQEAGEAR